jgi:hypothetical protein
LPLTRMVVGRRVHTKYPRTNTVAPTTARMTRRFENTRAVGFPLASDKSVPVDHDTNVHRIVEMGNDRCEHGAEVGDRPPPEEMLDPCSLC